MNLKIDGRLNAISEHPLKDQQPGEYRKTATVLAVQARDPGIVFTPEGPMEFHAGDYIVTDNPPTHAWPVKAHIFESTYVGIWDHADD